MTAGRLKPLYVFLRMMLGLIFVWAASSKILDPGGFACGLLLITGYLVRGSAVIVNLMLTVFIIALSLNIFRGIDINCGCFSQEAQSGTNMYSSLLWNLPMLAVGLWVLFFSCKSGNSLRLCETEKKSK
ncbi:MAG: hypothetical protein B6I22_09040 [Desulfobacteraceae bacterium 4572_123]|nr:MAG: hypothetical protein B6I22_09040 [Desulfobacteraceae bacterium 4572_123]